MLKICVICQEVFDAKKRNPNTKTCSKECRKKWHNISIREWRKTPKGIINKKKNDYKYRLKVKNNPILLKKQRTYFKKWKTKNREYCNKWFREYYKNHKKHLGELNKKYKTKCRAEREADMFLQGLTFGAVKGKEK